jgi:NAD(P)-dependent dehydrogenase (short-subunit alcohol dehydrogenase family)
LAAAGKLPIRRAQAQALELAGGEWLSNRRHLAAASAFKDGSFFVAQELSGKVAIITGGASGIGRGTVEMFVKEGARVVIADIDETKGEALAQRLGDAAAFRRCDVSRADELAALVDFAASRFGGLHVMFNNAAIQGGTAIRFLDDTFDDFDAVMRINLLGVMLGSQAAARQMARNGGGSIINTTSIAGYLPGYAFHAYRAAKAGVLQFSKSIAIDLCEYGVRVNCIAPAHIETEMTNYAEPGMTADQVRKIEEAMTPVWLSNQLLKRRGRPDDVANAAVYLASDRSSYVTGIQIAVDAGVTTGDPVNHIQEFMSAREKAAAAVRGG